ncbi:hypothetical protein FGADI_2674 [Fusarium gaditjirri]|uniref:Uncharacterized protein n=1 Tax=Fusarium gaditjirri TaxID=282569 RepID=A0A8H4THN2_9HYPO|nr:hypothetical protein FGADI_2674 [Fusarium gaditjirri]
MRAHILTAHPGSLSHRRSQGLNNIVDINDVVAGRDVRTTVRFNNIVDINELVDGPDAQTTIMLRNIPNKDGQPPSSKLSASLLGDSVSRRSVYGAHAIPRTVNFGVTPEEARALHRKQPESDSKSMCLGLSVHDKQAAEDAAKASAGEQDTIFEAQAQSSCHSISSREAGHGTPSKDIERISNEDASPAPATPSEKLPQLLKESLEIISNCIASDYYLELPFSLMITSSPPWHCQLLVLSLQNPEAKTSDLPLPPTALLDGIHSALDLPFHT